MYFQSYPPGSRHFQDQVSAVRFDASTLDTTTLGEDILAATVHGPCDHVAAAGGPSLNVRFDYAQAGEQILLLRVGDSGLTFGSLREFSKHSLCAGWTGVLAVRAGIHVHAGDARQLELPEVNLAKLQVFMDRAFDTVETGSNAAHACLQVPAENLECSEGLERWYVAQCLAGNSDYLQFARWLRQSERYQLVCFLLREGASGGKLCQLARRYGVSISHFRRLCHSALGGAAKPELRGWRTAQALLSISPDETLTDIALTFGFSSPSHFSKDIRDLLGVSPSSLNDITRLSSK
jgi:AraC-like DNA-binding protein